MIFLGLGLFGLLLLLVFDIWGATWFKPFKWSYKLFVLLLTFIECSILFLWLYQSDNIYILIVKNITGGDQKTKIDFLLISKSYEIISSEKINHELLRIYFNAYCKYKLNDLQSQ